MKIISQLINLNKKKKTKLKCPKTGIRLTNSLFTLQNEQNVQSQDEVVDLEYSR